MMMVLLALAMQVVMVIEKMVDREAAKLTDKITKGAKCILHSLAPCNEEATNKNCAASHFRPKRPPRVPLASVLPRISSKLVSTCPPSSPSSLLVSTCPPRMMLLFLELLPKFSCDTLNEPTLKNILIPPPKAYIFE